MLSVEKQSDGAMLSDALSRSLFPFLPQLPSLHNLPGIQPITALPLASPPLTGQVSSGAGPKHRCNLCGFECDNAGEYEQHLNTHFDHRCPYCDYTSKTEGRLKRHVKDFHEAPSSSDGPPMASVTSSTGPGSQHSESDDSSSQQNSTSGGGGSGGTQGACGGPNPGLQKPRISKCKQCGFVAETKTEFWEHSKTHIKQGKMLECPQCPFVTEYKHHLEYHLRNHFGSKPFKCVKCNYSCVNKSMLNSHMKSHSNVYQYRCENCNYATKYCHSLKLHLRKYGHKPAVVLNPDGTPNPYPIIDVYGTRRGPRPKKGAPGGSPGHGTMSSSSLPDAVPGQPLPFLQTPLADVASLLRTTQDWANFPFNWLPSAAEGGERSPMAGSALPELNLLTAAQVPGQTHLIFPSSEGDLASPPALTQLCESNMLAELASSMAELSSDGKPVTEHEGTPLDLQRSPTPTAMPTPDQSEADEVTEHSGPVKSEPIDWTLEEAPLDLSRSAPHSPVLPAAAAATLSTVPGSCAPEHPTQRPPTPPGPPTPVAEAPPQSPTTHEHQASPISPRKPATSAAVSSSSSSLSSSSSRRKGRAFKLETFQCDFCDMLFKDVDMFSMHMNYHGFEDPFKCHACGLQTANRLDFFVHLARDPHN